MKPVLLTLLAFMPFSLAAERVALVVGINAYRELPTSMQLTSPRYDALDVAAALQAIGYTLVTGSALVDADRSTLTAATEQFAKAARDSEAAVFYFSGHGLQIGDDNYILPSDTPHLTGLSVLKNRAVQIRDSVMVALEEVNAQNKILILDCCRSNPFSAQLEAAMNQIGKNIKTTGLGEITGYGPGFYLAFATSPGQTAADGNGARNSPFTAALLKAMPGSAAKDIDFFFRDVKALLPSDQISWTNHSIKSEFSLANKRNMTSEAKKITEDKPSNTSNVKVGYFEGVKAGEQKKFVLAPGVDLDFVWCPRGDLRRGSELVVIESGFWIASTECNQAQFQSVLGGPPVDKNKAKEAVCANWFLANDFCRKLTDRLVSNRDITTDFVAQLPNVDQWQYACLAGWSSLYGVGDGRTLSQKEANIEASWGTDITVRKYAPNSWGIFDMHGNLWEWTSDSKDDHHKIYCGGSWFGSRATAFSTGFEIKPNDHGWVVGFRPILARNATRKHKSN